MHTTTINKLSLNTFYDKTSFVIEESLFLEHEKMKFIGHVFAGMQKNKSNKGIILLVSKDEEIKFEEIIKMSENYDVFTGLKFIIWAMRSAPDYEKDWRIFSVWCSRESLKNTDDWRSVYAVNVADRYAHGMATKEEVENALAVSSQACEESKVGVLSGSNDMEIARANKKHSADTSAWLAINKNVIESAFGSAFSHLMSEGCSASISERDADNEKMNELGQIGIKQAFDKQKEKLLYIVK